jgi:hypothetical protein
MIILRQQSAKKIAKFAAFLMLFQPLILVAQKR